MNATVNELRQLNRKRRMELTPAALERAASALSDRIIALPEFDHAAKVAVYFAVNGEISLAPLIDEALARGKQLFLPNLDQQSLRFAPYFHQQKMRTNRFKLPEPDVADNEMLSPEDLDIVLAPLVVFDPQRNRIGMGGGFYDRSFAFRKKPQITRPVLIGVAHEFQKVAQLVPERWDVRLDKVVTDEAQY